MNRETTFRHALLVTAIMGIAQAGTALADEGAGTKAATACLNRANIRSTKVLDDRNVLFITRDRITYHNQLARQCLGMNRTTPLSFNANDRRVCAGSTFTVMLRTGASSNPCPTPHPARTSRSRCKAKTWYGARPARSDVRPRQRRPGRCAHGRNG